MSLYSDLNEVLTPYAQRIKDKADKSTTYTKTEVDDLISAELLNANAFDILGMCKHVNWTHRGVTFTWTDNSCAVSGTASGRDAIYSLFNSLNSLPSGMILGGKYRLKYESENVLFQVLINKNGAFNRILLSTYKDVNFELPSDAEGVTIRLAVLDGITVNETVSPVLLTDVLTNSEIMTTLKNYGSYDVLLGELRQKDGTSNGITYTWDNGVCTVNGTSTDYSANVLTPTFEDLPDEIVPGNKYTVMYSTTDSEVFLRIMFQNANSETVKICYINRYTNIKIPDGAVKWAFAIYVLTNKTINNAVVSEIALLSAKSNRRIEYLLLDGRNDVDYNPKTLCWYNIPEDTQSFDAKTMEGNAYTRGRYSVLAETFEGTNPPDILTRLTPSTYIIVEKHILNPYGNLYYLDVICQFPAFHLKMLNQNGYTWLRMERKYIYASELNQNKYLNLNTEYLYFRESLQTLDNNYYHSLVLPVKKGDTVYLRSKVSASGTVFSKIKYNYIVDYVYTDAKEYDGLITFDYDGFLAFNIQKSYVPTFLCYLETAKSQNVLRESQFQNALPVSNNVLPTYDDNNVCRVLQRGATWMGAIHHWGIIGASFDSGEFNWTNPSRPNHVSEIDWYEYSCWKYLQRINGIPDMYCYSDGGQNARDWIKLTHDPSHPERTHPRAFAYDSETEEAVPYWTYRSGIGTGGGCWWKMKQDYNDGNVKQAFVLNLGGNDINNENPHDEDWNEYAEGDYDATAKYKCGTIADVGTYDLATNTDTLPSGRTGEDTAITGIVNSFAGYMGAILNRLIAIQPECVIFLCTIHNMYADNPKRLALWNQYNTLIKALANMEQFRDHVLLLDAAEYGPNFNTYPQYSFWNYYHPNALGYVYMAWTWNTMIDYVMQKNLLSFKQSMFIGTGKKYTPIT